MQIKTVEINIPLLDEGTPTLRGTPARHLGDNLYEVLLAPNYDPEDENWEFKPGSIVKCDLYFNEYVGKKILRAYAVQKEDGTFELSEDAEYMGH